MANSLASQLILFSFLAISISLSQLAQASSKPPKALVLPISKDTATAQYVTQLNIGTPSTRKSLVVDLGGRHLWMVCNDGSFVSSTYRKGACGSAACSVAKGQGCQYNFTKYCYVDSQNTIFGDLGVGEVSMDTISLHSTDGFKSGPEFPISNFIFACANEWDNLDTLASGAKGMLGLGRKRIALPTQISSLFGGSFRRKFAICLPSTSKSNGVVFLGDSPYVFYPSYNTSKTIDVSTRFKHTKLHKNTQWTGSSDRVRGDESPDHFVKVTSILVNRKPIPINSTLLDFKVTGEGGTKISTVEPYGKLETSIYNALVKAFEEEMSVHNKVTKVEPVKPFGHCYDVRNMSMSLLGIGVPDIAFVFENKDVYWEMFGYNSMVEISRDVACLAFLDGWSVPPITPIVIGAHQLQDNLLQFDLAASRMSFTSTLLWEEVQCSNFKF